MKKLHALAIALFASLAFTAPAHAFLIDGFGDDSGGNSVDTLGLTLATLPGPTLQTITDTDFGSADRTLEVSQTSPTENLDGVSLNVDNGQLNYSTSTGIEGAQGDVTWSNFGNFDFTGPIRVLVRVLFSDNADLGPTADEAELTVLMADNDDTGTSISATGVIPHAPLSATDFVLELSPGDLAGVDFVSMNINNKDARALDLEIDFLEVPAPGVLGLLGIGLLGLGFSMRKRRSTKAA